MSEEITKEIENVDELFKEIIINGQTFTSEKEIKPKVKRETPSQQPSPEPEPLPVPSEPVEVTKTVENVDEQFFEIVLNGNTIQSDKAPSTILKVTRSPKQNNIEIVNDPEPIQGQNVKTINLNNILHDFEDPNAYSAIQQIQTEINQLQSRLNTLIALVPPQASASNQLADKAFVNSSVQTATANFRGNWNNFSSVPTDASLYPVDYAGSKTPTVNDYLVVQDASDYTEDTLEGTWRFKYSGTWSVEGKNGWRPEYLVNETPLTQAQLQALNSGITAQAVASMATIDDTTPSSTKAYSSLKTQTELNGKVKTESNSLQEIKSTSTTDTPLVLHSNSTDGECWIGFKNRNNILGYFGLNENKVPLFNNGSEGYELATTSQIPIKTSQLINDNGVRNYIGLNRGTFGYSTDQNVNLADFMLKLCDVGLATNMYSSLITIQYSWADNFNLVYGSNVIEMGGGATIIVSGECLSAWGMAKAIIIGGESRTHAKGQIWVVHASKQSPIATVPMIYCRVI